ncbi:putative histone-lysine N-methyltransferase suvh protein, partial [Trifolium medium]|nr:putative histone-lysine N-methyltransferase suvh protein [Trifolium medium]
KQESSLEVVVGKMKENSGDEERVSNLSMKDKIHLCGVMRTTRMIYDLLCLLASDVKEKRMDEDKRLVA